MPPRHLGDPHRNHVTFFGEGREAETIHCTDLNQSIWGLLGDTVNSDQTRAGLKHAAVIAVIAFRPSCHNVVT